MLRRCAAICAVLLAAPAGGVPPLLALVQPSSSPVAAKAFRHPALYVQERNEPASAVLPLAPAVRDAELAELGATATGAFFDSRTGRWSSLVLARPMLPGSGVGNRVSWISGHPPADDAEWRDAAAAAVLGYVRGQAALRIDPSQISSTPRAAVLPGGDLVYVYIPRVVDGIPVRGNAVTATLNHGNLVLLGLPSWGNIDAALSPSITASDAEARAEAFLDPFRVESRPRRTHLELIPADGGDALSYRLAWVVESRVAGDLGRWETLVDAKTGEILALEDRNQYAQHSIVGGVFPVSNDGSGPEGTEQAGFPMPWADVAPGGTSFTDGGGNAGCIPGSISTTLSGRFVKILDTCGAISETNAGDINLGTSAGTDCTVPAGKSAGDTHSARSGFYELNRMKEQARGQLPTNLWLQLRLTANMNIVDICNAFWDGNAVNFFRSGGGCGNTGEIAAVFDHEWGHGLDNNGVNPTISSPGESIADIYAALRLNTSCIGRGFLLASDCTGYGDPCLDCSGVREIDWAKHTSNAPHGITFASTTCPAVGSRGPCNREVHCEGMLAGEVAWDLATRDLTAAPFNYSTELAREVSTRLFYLGSQVIVNWYGCFVNGGCGATGGYLNVLAADDDNGNLADGTPHMTAIFAAFNRHQIACLTPAVANSGCAGAPTGAPTVTAQASDRSARLSWTAVANATSYAVYRTEGVAGCEFGKVKLAETADLSYFDDGLQNGRTYFYSVLPLGTSDACFGTMSVCASVVPAAGSNLGVVSVHPAVSGGDGDPFLDNCELATATIDVANTGSVTQTNVRIVAIEPVTHPSTTIVSSLPIAVSPSLAECDTAQAAFQIRAQGLAFDETSEVRVTLASDQLDALGQTRTVTLRFENVESDFEAVATQTYGFETNLENWKVVSGTFARSTAGGGAGGTTTHVTSSQNADFACDVIRSPLIRVGAGVSTLTMQVRYAIEPTSDQVYDRANVSLYDAATGASTVISPSAGQAYTGGASFPFGCVLDHENGWNGTNPGNPAFVASTWSTGALSPGGTFDNKIVRLEIAYGTDEVISLAGFDFDQVALTNVEIQVPDTQSDVCLPPGNILPEALHVDAAGNGVLDAGESAVIAPSWKNPDVAAAAVTGSLSNFHGPAGPTYTIEDGTADYGTIAGGASVFCADCYSVSIAAVTRPAMHWDATASEAVTGGVAPKTWSLHVGGSFTDVTHDAFYPWIENILHNGVTGGCGGSLFCPGSTVTREQMAVFLLTAKEGIGYAPPPCVTPAFADVPCSSPFAKWVNELVARGVTAGCGGGLYCPTNPTTREQMAVLLLTAKEGSGYVPPACVTPEFADVPCSSPFAKWVNELVARGVTAGCGGGLYCPTNPVQRQQMAVFLVTTFGLRLYGL